MRREIVEKLPDELERYRRNGQRLTEDPRKDLISHLYLPWSKDWIVQLKFLKPDTFEIVSFYKKRQKSLISCLFSYFFVSYAIISQIFSLRKARSFGSPSKFGY